MDPARLPCYSLSATIPAPCRDVRAMEHHLPQALQPREGGVLDDGFGQAGHRYLSSRLSKAGRVPSRISTTALLIVGASIAPDT